MPSPSLSNRYPLSPASVNSPTISYSTPQSEPSASLPYQLQSGTYSSPRIRRLSTQSNYSSPSLSAKSVEQKRRSYNLENVLSNPGWKVGVNF